MALAYGLICPAVLLVREITGSAVQAFQSMSGLGIAGWLAAVFKATGRIRYGAVLAAVFLSMPASTNCCFMGKLVALSVAFRL
jgi:hypothetical protein